MKVFNLIVLSCLLSFASCSQDEANIAEIKDDAKKSECGEEKTQSEPHQYGGWYCPDNLNGFPAVDFARWNEVPVVNGRMATKEETQNGTSLIYVDELQYPMAKPLDMVMPQLATIYNYSTQRKEVIILIQAINISNDSIVGFRYLNGGNGSARLHEVALLSENEIGEYPLTQFVSIDLDIDASDEEVWKVLTDKSYLPQLQETFDLEKSFGNEWRGMTNLNFHYPVTGFKTASFADRHFGAYYIQNDFDYLGYSQKILLIEKEEDQLTEMKVVCGPFAGDFRQQEEIVKNWTEKVKSLSEAK
ncbi:MAG: hypothetical protein AAF487_00510 [Bacteroidota bacterium]